MSEICKFTLSWNQDQKHSTEYIAHTAKVFQNTLDGQNIR